MPTDRPNSAERIRSQLDHPVIDADGHYLEYQPALSRYLRDEGLDAETLLDGEIALGVGTWGYTGMSEEERRRQRATRTAWWAAPSANTLDVATATFPSLLAERLDELGIDFVVMYGSAGLVYPIIADDETRIRACRALNRYAAEAFADHSNRMTPAAVIPMHTPDEAIEMLEFAVGDLGMKAAMIAGLVQRPIEDPGGSAYNVWWDTLGLDSAYDYDPFWRRCLELGISPACHSSTMGIGLRRSTSTYMYNHIGHFAAASEAFAKSLFFGGVTQRFPALRIGLLEGGVHWGVGLYADLISRWEKRNSEAILTYDPRRLDATLFQELAGQYGGRLRAHGLAATPLRPGDWAADGPHDDFAALKLTRKEDVRDRFVPNFFFGCEADDPMTATAFDRDRIPLGASISAMFSSDIGHWDVPDMKEVLGEAFENVEKGWLDSDQFRDFVFGNVLRFYTDTNPDFFRGTVVEESVATALASNDRA
ncbi:MAG: amidohydrolase family protein [bacterium]|nr:amidohydrolase [Deltaproteobacteria bacterium]MCP4904021.1 amidohydrolase family protein [bacterium]